MNATELARKLKIPTKELLEILPAVGFDIGRRAIKIDNRQAQKIIEQWPRLLAEYKEKLAAVAATEEVVETKTEGPKKIAIPAVIRVRDFAQKLAIPLSKVMADLMKNGVLSSMNEEIDFDTASIVGQDLGFEVVSDNQSSGQEEKNKSETLETLLAETDKTKLKMRAPVVVIMGHVDHGKTKLLDAIRKTNVMEGESGGITQHIGAYQVETEHKGAKKTITFLDTPGHEAFKAMRSRGGQIADLAILVVAADDGLKPQTLESLAIIQKEKLPFIVAINKIDKESADIERVKKELTEVNILPEDWGGKTITAPISALKGQGIKELLDLALLVADMEELKADASGTAVGTIIESHIDKGEGPVATVLVQAGTLNREDLLIVGPVAGKVKALKDWNGADVDRATPGMPVKILGLKNLPEVGE